MMPQHEKLQKQLKQMVEKNLREVLQMLKQVFEHTNKYNLVISLNTQLNELTNHRIIGSLSKEEELRTFNQISNNILMLIDQIDEEIASAYELEHSIFTRFLVICKSPERKVYLQRLFPETRYKEVHFDYSLLPYPKETTNTYDLIVFDNLPHQGIYDEETNNKFDHLLPYYLEETLPLVLYLGPFSSLINQYPEKVYASNSIFSIHARIQEMMSFIKYYQAESPA